MSSGNLYSITGIWRTPVSNRARNRITGAMVRHRCGNKGQCRVPGIGEAGELFPAQEMVVERVFRDFLDGYMGESGVR